jgi:hypothetical protein
MIYGYARVSTDAQDLAIQLDTLRAAGCEKVFHDKESGDSAERPQLKRLMKRLGAGDVVKAPATDRFARDPIDLLVLGRDIRAKGGAVCVDCRADRGHRERVLRAGGGLLWDHSQVRVAAHPRAHGGRPGRGQGARSEVRAQAEADPAPNTGGSTATRRG